MPLTDRRTHDVGEPAAAVPRRQPVRRRSGAAGGAGARGRGLGRRPRARLRRRGRLGRGPGARPAGGAQRAPAGDARPLRAPGRSRGLRPELALAAARRRRARDPRAALALSARGRARRRAPRSSCCGRTPTPASMCPVSMTYSAVPALRTDPELAAEWEPRLTLPDYERGALCGMAMTEKQGGSDVRAGTTRAEPAGGGAFELTGHKWFCSHPMCDVFLVLAQAPGGLSCFVVERGPGFELQRLKDKLGTRSLASSEVEFRAAPARLLGEEGRGVATIIEMVTHTRLDCIVGSAAGMRRGVAEAIHHARHRAAFGARLVEQPAMVNVLADLAVESEAATAAALRLARAYDEDDKPLRRFGTAVMKYWICKRATRARRRGARVPRRQRLRGGVADAAAAARRAARTGSGRDRATSSRSTCCARSRASPDGLPAFLAECELGRGRGPAARRGTWTRCRARAAELDGAGRPVARRAGRSRTLALAFQASLLVRHAPPSVADAFCAARLGGGGRAFGTLPAGSTASDRGARAGRRRARPVRPGALVDCAADDAAATCSATGAGRRDRRPGLRQPGRRRPARSSSACPASRATGTTSRRTRSPAAPWRSSWRGRSGSACRRCWSSDVRAAMARAAARFHGDPTAELPVVGVTGTSGKTTTTYLVRPPARGGGSAVRAARRASRRSWPAAQRPVGPHDAGGDRPAGHLPGDARRRRPRVRHGGLLARARAAPGRRDALRRRRPSPT